MGIVRLGTFGIFLSVLLVVLGFLLISTGVFAEPKEVVEGPSEYSVQAVPESMDRRLEQMSISTKQRANLARWVGTPTFTSCIIGAIASESY